MVLNQTQFADSVNLLFDSNLNLNNSEELSEATVAYQNLAMHFIGLKANRLLGHVGFDPVRMALMIKRFHRDAFGVSHFSAFLRAKVAARELDADVKTEIEEQLKTLSIRINSPLPRKIRIAAAFALWATTLRPLYLLNIEPGQERRLWRLDATITFWITTSYLEKYGTIQIGSPDNLDDFDTRIARIWYDFTFRDLNLSSLELMYSSIFRPDTRPVTVPLRVV